MASSSSTSRGLLDFMEEHSVFQSYDLRDTVLLVDGPSLIEALFRHCQQVHFGGAGGALSAPRNDQLFGGDYAYWSDYVLHFLLTLENCKVTSIVLLDGVVWSTKSDTEKLIENDDLSQRISDMRRQYERSVAGVPDFASSPFTVPLMVTEVFLDVCKRFDTSVHIFRCMADVEPILRLLSVELPRLMPYKGVCQSPPPILSENVNFLLKDTPGGVISIRSFLLVNFPSFPASTAQQPQQTLLTQLQCSLYRISYLKETFPCLKDNATVNPDKPFTFDLTLIPRIELISRFFRTFTMENWEHFPSKHVPEAKVYAFLFWLAGRNFTSLEAAQEAWEFNLMVERMGALEKPLEANEQPVPSEADNIDAFIVQQFEGKINSEQIPSWILQKYIFCDLQKRTFRELLCRQEFCRPLVEDHSLPYSCYKSSLQLSRRIYGVHSPGGGKISREERDGGSMNTALVAPEVSILQVALKDLPNLFEANRLDAFYQITGISKEVIDQMRTILSSVNAEFTIDKKMADQIVTGLIALVHLCRDESTYSMDIWIEFVYALFVNILLGGYFTSGFDKANAITGHRTAPMVRLSTEDVQALVRNLVNTFSKLPRLCPQSSLTKQNQSLTNGNVPSAASTSVVWSSHQPRIVHLYNCFQVTLMNVCRLAECLDLSATFHAEDLLCNLQGSTIHNLTIYLAILRNKDPLVELKQLFPPALWTVIASELLPLVLEQSKRTLLLENWAMSPSVNRGDAVPANLMKNFTYKASRDANTGYFVFASGHLYPTGNAV